MGKSHTNDQFCVEFRQKITPANLDRNDNFPTGVTAKCFQKQLLWAMKPQRAAFKEKGEIVEDREEFRSAGMRPPKKSSSEII